MRPLYAHTQMGWLLLIVTAAGMVLLLAVGTQQPAGDAALMALAALLPVVALVFSRLTVRIEHDRLTVAFGFGWPRRTLRLADIAAAEITRTRWIEGWGIRLTRRGWLWNVSGLDAVALQLVTGKQLLIGTDEPRRLHAAIERARAAAAARPRR